MRKRIMKRRPLAALGVTGLLIVVALLAFAGFASSATGSQTNHNMRWDIIHLNFATLTLSPGGHASAFATSSGGSASAGKITVTGGGTFRSNAGNPQDVTGGGMWQTFDGAGSPTGSGTYQVTGLVDFDLASGSLPPAITDDTGVKADVRAGLVALTIAYSDGSDGILVVSCSLPVGSPPTLFEGITASKGYVDYWERDPAVAGVDANRTNFHTLQ